MMLISIRRRMGRALASCMAILFFAGVIPSPAQFMPPPVPVQPTREGAVTTRPAQLEPAEPETSGHPLLNKDAADKLISVNFRDAPLDQVLTFYSELVGRTLLKSPGINATITLRGTTKLTTREALEAIESVLAMNNVALVPMGDKFLKVVQPTAVRQEGMPISLQRSDKPFPETDQLISQIVQLKYVEMTEAQNVIQGFLHGYGKIQPLERANSLLITETAMNLQRILEILDLLDQPTEARVETRIYELKYAEAGKIASRLNELVADAQAKDEKPQIAAALQPAIPSPPGVIRPGRVPGRAGAESMVSDAEAALAERGIVQGKVKIVADERTNILIVIARPPNFAFFDKIVAILDRPVEPDVIVRVVALEFAKAEEIASILNEFIGAAKSDAKSGAAAAGAATAGTEAAGGRSQVLEDYVAQRAAATDRIRQAVSDEKAKIGELSPNTKILADKRTNSLLLMGTKADIAALEDVIDRLDTMLAQVLIEAVILEISLSRGLEYGVDWLQRSMTAYNTQNAGAGGGVAVREPVYAFGGGQNLSGSTFIDAGTVGRATALGSGLTYFSTIFDLNIDVILRMAASSSDARILSTPVILTTDNTEAKIIVGEERPVVTSTSTSTAGQQTSAYEYRNIGINLTVTPRINPQRFVVMEITQTADNVGGFEVIDQNNVPIITKREMQASIAVPSRSTIILGGLVSTDARNTRSKVPILGDIPLIGTLFRSDSRNNARTELMVLITPYVLTTPEEARAETERLHESTRAAQARWYRGWSDSELSRPTRAQLREQKRAERDAAKHEAAEQKKLDEGKGMPVQTTPRISLVAPSDISTEDLRDEADRANEATAVTSEAEPVDAVAPDAQEEWVVEQVSETPVAAEVAPVDEPEDALPPAAEEDAYAPVPMNGL